MKYLSKHGGLEIEEYLMRCLEGKAITPQEAHHLIEVEDSQLPILMAISSIIRDRGNGCKISYSRNVFIPLTNICRNRCCYCGFRRDPSETDAKLMTPSQVVDLAQRGEAADCTEALFCLGEKPECKYEDYSKGLKRLGYENTIDYLCDMCEMIFKKTRLLPHSNPGLVDKDEIKRMREFNVSLGLMLESVSERLCEKGNPHELSPGKDPKLRLRMMEYAGQLRIPFSTGLLIGIGENHEERIDSLFTIKKLHKKYGHIQEVIIQNFRSESRTKMGHHPEPTIEEILKTLVVARLIFGNEISIQAPPNLNSKYCDLYILSGINDWGGISPITKDFINPKFSWPKIEELERITEKIGYEFKERLPIYPKYTKKSDFMSEFVKGKISSLTNNQGFVRR